MNGFRIFSPPIYIDDWRAAYGLECIRIWREAVAYRTATGRELETYFPTEDEFREMRGAVGKKKVLGAGG